MSVVIDGVDYVPCNGPYEQALRDKNNEIMRLKDLLRRDHAARSAHLTAIMATDDEIARLNSEIASLRETLKKEQECHLSEEGQSLSAVQNALAEINRLNREVGCLKAQRANEIAAWVDARDYWRDKASEYGTALAVSDKAVAVYENAIDCLTAEVDSLKGAYIMPTHVNGVPIETVLNLITAWRLAFCPPISEAFFSPADLRTANEAIKLLGEGFAREINAANAYRAGLVAEAGLFQGMPTALAYKTVISALKQGDAARKAQ